MVRIQEDHRVRVMPLRKKFRDETVIRLISIAGMVEEVVSQGADVSQSEMRLVVARAECGERVQQVFVV